MKNFISRFYWSIPLLTALVITGLTDLPAKDELSQTETDLTSAIQKNDLNKVIAATSYAAGINNEKAAKLLLKHLSKIATADKYEFYWAILKSITLFTDEKALETVGDFIITNKDKPLGEDTLFIMKDNHSPATVKLLGAVLEKGTHQQKDLALDYLGQIRTKAAIAALVEILKHFDEKKDERLIKQTIETLQGLLGQSIGQTVSSIIQWWNEHQNDDEKTFFQKNISVDRTTGTAVDQITEAVRLNGYNKITQLPKDKIIVISSDCAGCKKTGRKEEEIQSLHNFDQIEQILTKMRVPHTVVKKSEFDSPGYSINDKIVVLMNCNQFMDHCVNPAHHGTERPGAWRMGTCEGPGEHMNASTKLSDKSTKKIQDFVAGGGYFFSEDAVLEEVLVHAFKGIISFNKHYPKKNVTVLPAPGSSAHSYLKGVFEKVSSAKPQTSDRSDTVAVKLKDLNIGESQWQVDDQSPNINIEKSREVTVLLVSPELKLEAGDSGAIAVTFNYNQSGAVLTPTANSEKYLPTKKTGGTVLHVLSHFGKQKEASDEFVLQNLLLNFLMEAAERYYARTKK